MPGERLQQIPEGHSPGLCDADATGARSSHTVAIVPRSIGEPGSGCWATTRPVPRRRAVMPSCARVRSDSRALSPRRSGSTDVPPGATLLIDAATFLVSAVAMSGGDILSAHEKSVIDAAEWCCPKPDSVFGLQKVLKHYYMEGAAGAGRQ